MIHNIHSLTVEITICSQAVVLPMPDLGLEPIPTNGYFLKLSKYFKLKIEIWAYLIWRIFLSICLWCVSVFGGVHTHTHRTSKYIWYNSSSAMERKPILTIYSPLRNGGGKMNFIYNSYLILLSLTEEKKIILWKSQHDSTCIAILTNLPN